MLAGCADRDGTATSTLTDRTTVTDTETDSPSATPSPTDTPANTRTDTPTNTPTESPRDIECGQQWNPRVRWSFDTGTRAGSPTIADGTVYFASQDDHLYALDATNSQVIWHVEQDPNWAVAPVVADGILTHTGDRRVAAYDAATGSLQWAFAPPGNRVTLAGEFGDDGETIYLGAWNHSGPSIGVENPYDRVYALDRRTGKEVWTTTFAASRDTYVQPRAVTVGGGRVFVTVGNHDGYLIALDSTTGVELWRHSIGDPFGQPVVAEDTVYVLDDGRLVALDGTSGAVQWVAGGEQPPGVGEGVVFCPKDGTLRAYTATDGQTRWEATLPDGGCGGRPSQVGSVVYLPTSCLDGNGRLYAFDAERGCRLGVFEVQSAVPTAPAVAGETLYTGGRNGAAKLWAVSVP